MPLVKDGAILDDPYRRIPDHDPLPDGAAVLVSSERLLADANGLAGRTGKLGVLWPNQRPIRELVPHLNLMSLVALIFPTFRDGRAYSQALLLRERYNFRGELRATGDVLRDQHLFLRRAGFDAFEVKKPADAIFFTNAPRVFSSVYQPAADRRPTAFQRRLESNVEVRDPSNAAAVIGE